MLPDQRRRDRADIGGPFQLLPSTEKLRGRPLLLDPHTTDLSTDNPEETDARMYKTTNRTIYDNATARVGQSQSWVF
jgi:hypothetical protein